MFTMTDSLMKTGFNHSSWLIAKIWRSHFNVRATVLALPLFPTVNKIYWHLRRVLNSAHACLTFISRDVCLNFLPYALVFTGIHGGPVLSEWKL